MVFAAVRTHFLRKSISIFMLIAILSREKKYTIKLTSTSSDSVRGLVNTGGIMPACDAGELGSMLSRGINNSFSFFFLFNDLNESIFTN